MTPPLLTLQSLLDDLPSWGERRALGLRGDFGFRWWSYRRLHRNTLRAASALRRRSIAPGSRILLWAPNSPEWVAYLLGASLIGAVIVPIDASASAAEVAERYAQVGASLLLRGAAHATDGLFLPTEIIDGLEDVPEWTHSIDALRTSIAPGDPAVVLFTAGSTGDATAVTLSHGNLCAQMRHFGYWRPVLRIFRARLLALSPLSHIQGLMLSACVPLSLGLSVVYTHSIEPRHLQRTLREARARLLSTVPRILSLMEQSMRAQAGVQPSWRMRRKLLGWRFRAVLVGGATLPQSAETFWRRCGCLVVQGYGATETAAFATINRPFFGTRGSIGLAVHNGSIQLSPQGEVLVRGPHVAEAHPRRAPDGFLRTGDLARRDSRGRFFFLGRSDERIVTAEGHTLHPNTMETALREIVGVDDAVVFAVAAAGLEHVHATLQLAPGAEPVATLIGRANASLPATHTIRSWSVWPQRDFPRGPLAKIQRQQVILAERARLAAGSAPQPAIENSAAERDVSIEKVLCDPDHQRRMHRLVPFLHEQHPNASFDDVMSFAKPLGLDSIEAAILMTLLFELADATSDTLAPIGTQHGEFPPPSTAPRRNPPWQLWPGTGLLRIAVQWLVLDVALPWKLHVEVEGLHHLREIRVPVMFVLAEDDRNGYIDYLAVLRALPSEWRRRIVMLVGDRLALGSYFFRRPEDSRAWRLYVAWLARFGVPAVAPYLLSAGGTVLGIREICSAIDRGQAPLMTWNRAGATAVAETRVAIVPIRLALRGEDRRREGFSLVFGPAIPAGSGLNATQIFHLVHTHLRNLHITSSPAATSHEHIAYP